MSPQFRGPTRMSRRYHCERRLLAAKGGLACGENISLTFPDWRRSFLGPLLGSLSRASQKGS